MILNIFIILVLISVVDILFLRIPELLNIVLFLNTLSYALLSEIEKSFLGAFIGLMVFILTYFLSHGSLGEGDIKLVISLGLISGYPGILDLILFSIIMSIIIYLINKKRKAQVLPFAPFLSIALIIILSYKVVLSNLPWLF